MEDPIILICDCSSAEHQIVFTHDAEDKECYAQIHLNCNPFWRRFWIGLKFIFGYKSRYGHWDTFILKPEHAKHLRELADKLEA